MSPKHFELEALLETFTTSQLRELDLSLAHPGEGPTKAQNHEDLIKKIATRREGKKLVAHALRLEAIYPYKHVFLFSFNPSGNGSAFEHLRKRVDKGFPGLFEKPVLVEPSEDELQPEVCVLDRERKRLLVKFVHLVKTWQWEWSSTTKKEMKPYQRRHPVVVSILPHEKLITVSFPGYTQGTFPVKMQRTTYTDIAQNACVALAERTDIQPRAFPLRETIDLILQKEPDVVDSRQYLKDETGRLLLDSREGDSGSASFLAGKFDREANTVVSLQAIRKVLGSMTAVDILLHWKKKELFTRIAFHDVAPEILFIWKSTAPDAALIDETIKMFVEYQQYSSPGKLSEAMEFIEKSSPGTVIMPTAIGQKFNLSTDEVLNLSHRAMERGVVEILFKVKTDDQLAGFENKWRTNLSDFPHTVSDENDNSIDLADHKNIEVAFRRLSA